MIRQWIEPAPGGYVYDLFHFYLFVHINTTRRLPCYRGLHNLRASPEFHFRVDPIDCTFGMEFRVASFQYGLDPIDPQSFCGFQAMQLGNINIRSLHGVVWDQVNSVEGEFNARYPLHLSSLRCCYKVTRSRTRAAESSERLEVPLLGGGKYLSQIN